MRVLTGREAVVGAALLAQLTVSSAVAAVAPFEGRDVVAAAPVERTPTSTRQADVDAVADRRARAAAAAEQAARTAAEAQARAQAAGRADAGARTAAPAPAAPAPATTTPPPPVPPPTPRRSTALRAAAPAGPPAAAPDARAEYGARVVTGVNAERRAHGLPAVVGDGCAERYADAHADRMAAQGRIRHQPLEPVLDACGAQQVSENVGQGDVSPERMVELWMASASHRATVLDPALQAVGTGASRAGDGRWFACQVFVGR